MTIVGTWKLDAVKSFDTDEYMTVEEFINELPSYVDATDAEEVEHERSQRKMQAESILNITEDGRIESLMPIPYDQYSKEEIDAAVAEGDIVLKGDMMLIDENEWKEDLGRFYISCGTVTEGDGKPQTNWEEIGIEGDKIVVITMRYTRA